MVAPNYRNVVYSGPGREFSMQFQISPPPAVRPGVKISIPIIVSIRPNAPRPLDPIEQLVVFASLRNESGDRQVQGLAGDISDGLHSQEHNSMRGYSKFEGLSIQEPGRYRIRIYLGIATGNEIMAKQYIDSDVVHVHPQAGAAQKASASQIMVLRRLTSENLRISEQDIEAWAR